MHAALDVEATLQRLADERLLVPLQLEQIGPLVAVVASGVLIYKWISDEKERQAKALTLIGPAQLTFNDVSLGQAYGSWKVLGTVQNNSSQYTLTGFTCW